MLLGPDNRNIMKADRNTVRKGGAYARQCGVIHGVTHN